MDTSSFCTSVQSILLLLGLAKLEKLSVHAVEIKTAYLHADVKSDVHARMLKKLIPYPLDLPQLPLRDGTASIKVRKAAYGLAEASHPMVSSLLHQLGYKSSAFDIGVLYRFNKEGPVYILHHVDDMLVLSCHAKYWKELKDTSPSTSSLPSYLVRGPSHVSVERLAARRPQGHL